VPLIRSLVSIPAGFRRMNVGVFTLYTAIGSLIWNTALIGAGYVLRDNWHDVEPILSVVQYVVIALIVAAIGWLLWTRVFSPAAKAARSSSQG
jgi:membrane protein DedA with SNARE-associated domain